MTTRVTFLGDICTSSKRPQLPPELFEFLSISDVTIANIEGPIINKPHAPLKNALVYNGTNVLGLLGSLGVNVAILANNHIMDIPNGLEGTLKTLSNAGISCCGAGINLNDAQKSVIIRSHGTHFAIINFGWEAIGCQPAKNNRPGVNPLRPNAVISQIRNLKELHKNNFIIPILHWNYELERWPQPADRQMARRFINEGAGIVIGSHSHVAQGIEWFNGKPIIYSLGNFWFPPRRNDKFTLQYPAISKRELAVQIEVDEKTNIKSLKLLWLLCSHDTSSIFIEKLENYGGAITNELTPFDGMSHKKYINWFRKNRTRRNFLPIYKNVNSILLNKLFDRFVQLRQLIINVLIFLNIKKKLSRETEKKL